MDSETILAWAVRSFLCCPLVCERFVRVHKYNNKLGFLMKRGDMQGEGLRTAIL